MDAHQHEPVTGRPSPAPDGPTISPGDAPLRVRVTVELDVEVRDLAALTAWAQDDVRNGAEERANPRDVADDFDWVTTDPAGAVQWGVLPQLLLDDLPGVVAAGWRMSSAVVTPEAERRDSQVDFDRLTAPYARLSPIPEFATLFGSRQEGTAGGAEDDDDDADEDEDEDEVRIEAELTPRTALALWSVLSVLADRAYDDIDENENAPVSDSGHWLVLTDFPRVTWRQDVAWRRQAARAFDDLAADLAAGHLPVPTCAFDEMAMHLALEQLSDAEETEFIDPVALSSLPESDDDLDAEVVRDLVFRDTDILALFRNDLDGLEDPNDQTNAKLGMGDYRPAAWAEPFGGIARRDPARGFRR